MINLLYKFFNFDRSKFDIDLFFINYILPKMSLFGFFNILFVCFIFFLFFLYKFIFKYTRIKKIFLLKKFVKSALFGFILGLFIYLWSNFTFCDNEINTSLKDNFFNTDLKINLAKIIIGTCVLYGLYKIGSIYYFNLKINRDNYLIERDKFLNNQNIKNIIPTNNLNSVNSNNNLLLIQRESQLKNLHEAELLQMKIFSRLHSYFNSIDFNVETTILKYKRLYTVNQLIIKYNLGEFEINDNIYQKLQKTIDENIFIKNNDNKIQLLTIKDLRDNLLNQHIIDIYVCTPRLISDFYMHHFIKSSETILNDINLNKKYSVDLKKLNTIKSNIDIKLANINYTYNALKFNINSIKSLDENIILENNIILIEKNCYCWKVLCKELCDYTNYLNSIPETLLIEPNINLNYDLVNNNFEIVTIKKLKYNSVDDIPVIIDITGTYFNGLKFFIYNFGYVIFYIPFFIGNKFFGIGNPIPLEIFKKSLKYFLTFKFFF